MSENNQIVKTIKVRLINTHDTAINWKEIETSFIPSAGEFIIYDDAYNSMPRAKIGDGKTSLGQLPFSTTPVWVGTKAEYAAEGSKLPVGTIVYITDDGQADEDAATLAELPVASLDYRGRIAVVNVNGNDQPFMCLYRGGNYSWYPIPIWGSSTGGSGEPDIPSSAETTAKLGQAKLGTMILGQE
jgi:hypothetical protein